MGRTGDKNPVFVLNHGNIKTDQSFSVIFSNQPPPLFNGDHLDYYCLQIEKFEFQNPKEGEWVFGREENPIFSKARNQSANSAEFNKCFEAASTPESTNIAAKVWSVESNREYIEGAVVIFYDKNTNRVLYVSFQT